MHTELVPNTVSRDLIEALETLLEGARQGHITGVAFAATLRGRRYITNVAGSCHRNLTHSRGMLAALSDELGDLLHGRDADETR
jgi:hypothetical protein